MTNTIFERVGIYSATLHGSGETFRCEINVENAQTPRLREALISSTIFDAQVLDPPLDVTASGHQEFIDDGGGERMETILKFIELYNQNQTRLRERIQSGFICNRGLLKNISMQKADFYAVRRKNVIFMCSRNAGQGNENRIRLISGKKFEQQITVNETTDNVLRTGNITKVVNRVTFSKENKPDITVFSSAEVDAIDDYGNIAEIKCWLDGKSTDIVRDFLQSYFGDISTVVIGHRIYYRGRYFVSRVQVHHRDDFVENRVGFRVEEYTSRVHNLLWKLKKVLNLNDKAVQVTLEKNLKPLFQEIDAADCDFVSSEFLNKFE